MSREWTRTEARETPVEGRCLWCKARPGKAPDDVEWVPVGEDEQLCSRCRADMREYGRAVLVQYWASSGLDAAVRRILKDAWETHVQPALAELYSDDHRLFQMPRVRSDAYGHDDPGLDHEYDR